MGASRRKRHAVVAVVGAAALLGALTADDLTRGDGDVSGGGANGHADVRLSGKQFQIAGDAIRPLSPGRSAPIDVKITNPYNSALRVTWLRVWVRSVAAPNEDETHLCSRLDFTVRQVRSAFAVTVPAGKTRSLSSLGVPRRAWPRVRMINRPVDQDGCKGASVTLAYRGSGSLRG